MLRLGQLNVILATTMKPTKALLLDLQSSDAAVRDIAALELMEIKDPHAILALIEAIIKPENANHRDTLVYALGGFNCLDHLEVLVDLVVTGNFEVSLCAFNIIEDFDFIAETMQRLRTQMDKHDINHLPFEHGKEGHAELNQLILNHRKSSDNST